MRLPHIKVIRRGQGAAVEIDGQQLPFPLDHSAIVEIDPDGAPRVTITLIGERVEVDNSLDGTFERPSPAEVEIFEDVGGKWRWRVKAGNGEIVALGESYSREEDADRGFRDAAAAIMSAAWS